MSKFVLNKTGVFERWKDESGKEQSVKICSPLEVVAYTRDAAANNWGRMLRWQDADGNPHDRVMHQADLAQGSRGVIASLLSGGLRIERDKALAVVDYIQGQDPDLRLTTVAEIGWCGDSFVLPDEVIGGGDGEHQLAYAPTGGLDKHLFAVAGTLDDWKCDVCSPCSGNSRAVFYIAASLSGPVPSLLGEEGGGFHLYGPTSGGKTTTQLVAGSVWGGGGKTGFCQSWRATANGLELVAAGHNDTCLVLDELGQLEPYEAVKVAYLLAGGQAKRRMAADGSGQQQKTWRLQLLSSGEVTMEQLAQSVGSKTRGGMEVRLANIPADAGKGLGTFEDIHGCDNPAQFANKLRHAATTCYGSVGREWIRHLVAQRNKCILRLRKGIARFETSHMPKGATAEVGRVVHRFAVMAAAGELATELGLTGWDAGEAERGTAACLQAWLTHRGGAGHGHDAEQMLRQVRHFLESHRASRFKEAPEHWSDGVAYAGPIRNMAGYYRCTGSSTTYYFQTEIFRSEVCKGFDHLQVLAALKDAKHLVHDKDRLDKQIEIMLGMRQKKRLRFIAIKDTLFTNENLLGEQLTNGK